MNSDVIFTFSINIQTFWLLIVIALWIILPIALNWQNKVRPHLPSTIMWEFFNLFVVLPALVFLALIAFIITAVIACGKFLTEINVLALNRVFKPSKKS